jgi:hypothetical protein
MNFFCHLPWTAVHINQKNCAPCCMYRPKDKSQLNTLENYLKSEELAQVKSQLLDGQAPVQCYSCVEREAANGHSFRILHNKFHDERTQEIQSNSAYNKPPSSLEVLTSNTCNLLCLPCHQGSSYVREVEFNKLGIKSTLVPHFKKNSVLDEVHKYDFEHISFLGGEPFGDKVTFECLRNLVAHGKSQNTRIDFNTNGTLIDQENIDFLSENFKFVYIKASIDGIGAVNDYLRYPSNWTDLEPRVLLAQKYSNMSLMLTSALSNLSIMRYYQVIGWAMENSIKDLFLTVVHDPLEMHFANLPPEIKSHLLGIYQNLKKKYAGQMSERIEFVIDICINSCLTESNQDFSTAMDWLQLHDRHRGNNILDIFPELEPYAKA